MKLGIVTVNYKNVPATLTFINSIESQLGDGDRLYIVDNGSESAKELEEAIEGKSSLELIKTSENLGFAGGNNIGTQKALENGSDWVVWLNNDTRVDPGFLAILKANLKGLEPSVVGIPLREGNDPETSKTAYAGKVKWLSETMPHIYDPTANFKSSDLYVIGGGAAIHKDVFKKIAYMDEKYFLYFDDVDFSIQARKVGIPIHFLTEPIIHHIVSSSTSKLGNPSVLYYHARHAMRFNFKNGSILIKLATLIGGIFIILKQTLKIIFRVKKEESLAILRGVVDFYRNRYGIYVK